MNPIYVFAKTEAGEDAVVQRTRLVQRNLRTVLILVDGKSTVEELVEKAGSTEMVTLALDQLEKDGFVRRVGTGVRKDAAEVKDARSVAGSSSSTDPAPMVPNGGAEKPRVQVEIPRTESDSGTKIQFPSDSSASTSKPPRAPTSPFGSSTVANPSANPFASGPTTATSSPVHPTPPSALPAAASPFQANNPSPFGGSPFGAVAPAPPSRSIPDHDIEAEVVEESEAPSKRYRPRGKLLTPRRIALSFVGVVVFLMLLVLFFPYGSYRHDIEMALSKAVGQKVTVGSVSAAFSPVPTLVINELNIGDGAQITVGEVRAVPSVMSLLTGRKAFRRISLSNAKVPMEQLGLLASGLGSAARGDVFSIAGVEFSGITVGLRDISLSGYSGRAEMTSEGVLQRMHLISPDQTLKLSIESAKTGAQLNIEGSNWKPGESSLYVFDSILIVGEMTGTRLQAQRIEGRIFGGVIQGQLALDWSTGMAVSGDVSVDYMSAAQFANAIGSGKLTLDGQANARVRFRASGASWNALAGKVPFEGDVILKGGAINGMDLIESVRRGSQLAMRGGSTRFEQAVGKFRWDGQALQLMDINLSSGMMKATGSMGVLRGEQISGAMNVVLKGSAATSATPVSIAGTLKDPQLYGGRR